MTKSCTLDRIEVRADDENGVSDAGLLVAATLGERLGLGRLLGEHLTEVGAGAGSAIDFMARRFRGAAPINTCASIP